jgi:hypothetical protein
LGKGGFFGWRIGSGGGDFIGRAGLEEEEGMER